MKIMDEKVFTFWEGDMPGYIRLCLDTWKVPYTVLNYNNVRDYTDVDIECLKRFSLSLAADIVRVHVLRDHGGYWMDTDTIMIKGELPDADLAGDLERRTHSIALLHSKPHSKMFNKWAEYQDRMIAANGLKNGKHPWYLMGNGFTDPYVKHHQDVRLCPIERYWPETYMVPGDESRFAKYNRFYFEQSCSLEDIRPTELLMLHNSWTPAWYKSLTKDQVLQTSCTLSNILRELTA